MQLQNLGTTSFKALYSKLLKQFNLAKENGIYERVISYPNDLLALQNFGKQTYLAINLI
jgi:hypothetical protein